MTARLAPGQASPVTVKRVGLRWQGRCYYRTPQDQPRDLKRYGDTRQQAIENTTHAVRDALIRHGGDGISPSITLRRLTELFLTKKLGQLDLAEESARVYRATLNKWILEGDHPALATTIGWSTPNQLSDLLHETGVYGGLGAAKMLRTALRHVYHYATQGNALTHNPALSATFATRAIQREQLELGIDKPSRGKPRAFTPTEETHILRCVTEDAEAVRLRLDTLLETLDRTGMRIGEACRLDRHHINPNAGTIDVPGTKTSNAARTIPAPAELLERLLAQPGTIMCPAPNGGRRDVSNTLADIRVFFNRHGYPWATSHTFRRTVATKLDKAGYTAREIADFLGHANPSMTLDKYMGRGQIRNDMSQHL